MKKFRAENERGCASVELLRPNVGRMTFSGHMTGEIAAPALEVLSSVFANSEMAIIVNDFSGLTSYESEVRSLCTAWVAGNRKRIHASLLYAVSPTVRMGVTMANLALKPMGMEVSLFEDEQSFRVATGGALRWSDTL